MIIIKRHTISQHNK